MMMMDRQLLNRNVTMTKSRYRWSDDVDYYEPKKKKQKEGLESYSIFQKKLWKNNCVPVPHSQSQSDHVLNVELPYSISHNRVSLNILEA